MNSVLMTPSTGARFSLASSAMGRDKSWRRNVGQLPWLSPTKMTASAPAAIKASRRARGDFMLSGRLSAPNKTIAALPLTSAATLPFAVTPAPVNINGRLLRA